MKKIPWSVLLYGVGGVGKSSLATHAPKPYFVDLENGLKRIECQKTRTVLKSWQDVEAVLNWAASDDASQFETIVVDTITELESLLEKDICKAHGRPTLPDFGYGKGFDLLERRWYGVFDLVDNILRAGRNVLFTGHDKIEKYDSPTEEPYDRYSPKLHKKSSPVVIAKVDGVLFMHWETVVRSKEQSDKMIASTTKRRLINTEEGAAWIAKNRFRLPEQIESSPQLFDLLK